MSIKFGVPLALAVGLAGCSSINSIEQPKPSYTEGLNYYMPKKDVLITIIVDDKKKVTSLVIGTTASYPDTSKRYVLNHKVNAFADSTTKVSLSTSGLLTTAKSTTTSKATDVFKALVSTATTVDVFTNNLALADPKEPTECIQKGSHSFIVSTIQNVQEKPPTETNEANSKENSTNIPVKTVAVAKKNVVTKTECHITVTVTKLGSLNFSKNNEQHSETAGKTVSGIYYRQDEPYRVEVTGRNILASKIIFSPSDSNTYLLPISKSFFSNNEAEFGFSYGVPNKYDQQTASELLSLLKLPADVIGAYFTAVGGVFDNFKKNDKSETDALVQARALDLEFLKQETCQTAIREEDDIEKVKAACK